MEWAALKEAARLRTPHSLATLLSNPQVALSLCPRDNLKFWLVSSAGGVTNFLGSQQMLKKKVPMEFYRFLLLPGRETSATQLMG